MCYVHFRLNADCSSYRAGYSKICSFDLVWDCVQYKNLTIYPSFVAIITNGKLVSPPIPPTATATRQPAIHSHINKYIYIVAVTVVVTTMGTMCDQSNLPLVPTISLHFPLAFTVAFLASTPSLLFTNYRDGSSTYKQSIFSSFILKWFYMHKILAAAN